MVWDVIDGSIITDNFKNEPFETFTQLFAWQKYNYSKKMIRILTNYLENTDKIFL